MAMMKKNPADGKWYDIDNPNVVTKNDDTRRYQRSKQKVYYQEKKNSEGYKLLHSTRWEKFRKHVIAADRGHCQRCIIKFNRYTYENLEVHHIKPRDIYPELTFDENNVITLCKSCNLELGLNGIDFPWNPKDRDDLYNLSIGSVDKNN